MRRACELGRWSDGCDVLPPPESSVHRATDQDVSVTGLTMISFLMIRSPIHNRNHHSDRKYLNNKLHMHMPLEGGGAEHPLASDGAAGRDVTPRRHQTVSKNPE